MLVLSRKKFEKILIGDSIEISVVEIRGDKVRLGVIAPSDVTVDRKEVRLSKLAEAARNARMGRTAQ